MHTFSPDGTMYLPDGWIMRQCTEYELLYYPNYQIWSPYIRYAPFHS